MWAKPAIDNRNVTGELGRELGRIFVSTVLVEHAVLKEERIS